ncbi:Uncharacterised protein [uncultured archaeon]|nr:Uncharacterised protein [uncultured archaeon]
MFGQIKLFTSHIEAMEFLRWENVGRAEKLRIKSTPMGLIKYWSEYKPELFQAINPYNFGYMVSG